jgi:hypothetical protein
MDKLKIVIIAIMLTTFHYNIYANSSIKEKEILEYKMDFIYKIIQYTTWVINDSIKFCIVGSEKDYKNLEKSNLSTINKRNMPILFRYNINALTNIDSCDVIFVPYRNKLLGEKIIKKAYKLPIITIGEKHMSWSCTMIGVDYYKDKIRFILNEQIYFASRLLIDPRVLRMGYTIKEECR